MLFGCRGVPPQLPFHLSYHATAKPATVDYIVYVSYIVSAMKKKTSKKAGKKPAKKPAKKQAKPAAKSSLGTPYGDRILVKPLPEDTVTSFGIIIPDTAREKPEQGKVVAVGPGKKSEDGKVIPVSVKVGDKIMFSKYGYDEVRIDGQDYYLIREESITYVF
jgi:chaperonin GroES